MKLDLSTFKPKDLNGVEHEIPDLCKILGNEIFKEAVTIEQTDLARSIWKGEEFEISEQDLDSVIQFLSQKPLIRIWIQSQVVEYLEGLKKEPENLEVSE